MSILPPDKNGCPYLQLAPMEGIGDRCFRQAIAITIGGFDEAVQEFLRVPKNAHVKSLACAYDAKELSPIPLTAQLMGSDPNLMAEMAREIADRGALRIDINCGCPSNTVTGRGAGSSLLKTPDDLNKIATAVVKAVTIPVTLKMRSGYEDTSLFKENILAAEESGIRYLTLHPRTKVDGYGPPAKWELIAEAKSMLKIPIVGNGDILNVKDALRMLALTRCDGIMIGRGILINPFLFQEIRAHFACTQYIPSSESLLKYLKSYLQNISLELPARTRINKLKQLFGFLFKKNIALQALRPLMLSSQYASAEDFFQHTQLLLQEHFE